MTSTAFAIVVFVAFLAITLILWALCLAVGLRWVKAPVVTTKRIVVATGIVTLLDVLLRVPLALVGPTSTVQQWAITAMGLFLAVSVPAFVVKRAFQLSLVRSLLAWIPTLFATVVSAILALLVFRPLVYEAFLTPANAMAPTLLGNHWRGTCAECGEPSYCSPAHAPYSGEDIKAICPGFHVAALAKSDQTVHSGDRFLVAKFHQPRRWDIVVFHPPHDRSTLYVMRLVGLPGENIHIESGAVWANGVEMTPPDALSGLEYISEFPQWSIDVSGTKNSPALLGPDEYFVLGDFSHQSNDSRFWPEGAPGHPPFAVPQSDMFGVVTHIYWPPNRWRVLR